MKYLDNLIAWGDSLFSQMTIETVNEATLCYALAANLLGPAAAEDPADRHHFRQVLQRPEEGRP